MLKKILVCVLLLFSVNSNSKSQLVLSDSESNGPKYICGYKCFSIDKVIFELRLSRKLISERDLWSFRVSRFEKLLKMDLKKLSTAHIIKMKTEARIESLVVDYQLQRSVLKVYVGIKEVPTFNSSEMVFEVVSLSENGNGFQRLVCKKIDDVCIDEIFSNIYEYHILENIRDIEAGRPSVQ